MTFKKGWQLFYSMFTLSAFTFGGGYVIVPLMKEKFVNKLKWIDEEEMLNFVAIAQSSPGAMAVNASILVGYKMGKVAGIAISILGTILPPLIILSVVTRFYNVFRDNLYVSAFLKGLQPAIVAIIVSVVISLGKNVVKKKEILPILIMAGSFVAACIFNVNVLLVILACALIGVIQAFILKKEVKHVN